MARAALADWISMRSGHFGFPLYWITRECANLAARAGEKAKQESEMNKSGWTMVGQQAKRASNQLQTPGGDQSCAESKGGQTNRRDIGKIGRAGQNSARKVGQERSNLGGTLQGYRTRLQRRPRLPFGLCQFCTSHRLSCVIPSQVCNGGHACW